MKWQSQAVIDAVSCPICQRGQGKYCIFRTGPNERIGTGLKQCHPERTAKATAPWKEWDKMEECKNWKRYKGIHKPRCNQGDGCSTCWAIYRSK